MARSCRLALLGLVTTTLGAVRVQGQEAPAPVRVEYRAPPECPTQQDFESRVLARTGKTGLYADGSAAFELFEVDLTPTPERTRGRLTTHARGAFPNVREIQAGTCQEAVDALALIVALTLDPMSVKRTSGEIPGKESGTTGTSGEAPTESDKQRPPTETAPTPPPAKKPPPSDEVARPEPGTGTGPWRFEMLAAGLLATGQAPDITPAGEVSLGFVVPAFDPHGFLFRFGLRAALVDEEVTPQGNASFRWITGHLAICPHFALSEAWAVAGCANAELGQLQAVGSETENAATSREFWLAMGPGLLSRWHFFRPLFLHGAAELDFALRRQRYLLGPEEVHETPVLLLRIEAGVGVQF